jgi:hypothetical protein
MPTPEHLSQAALGYAIHTNRELGMMLRGEKPLAVFSDAYGEFPEAVSRYLRRFDKHVEDGRLAKREYVEIEQSASTRCHVILFAIPGQAWRIDAMLDLRQHLSAWTAEHERMEGELLGYAGWQNDIWLSRRFPTPN